MNQGIELVKRMESKPLVYHDERVVTLAQIDEMHERVDGTAKRNFGAHRGKLLEGVDYFDCPASELESTKFVPSSHGGARRLILLTESGYLLLCKSFTDPLAWEIQGLLVRVYFHAKSISDSESARMFAEVLARQEHNHEQVCEKVHQLELAIFATQRRQDLTKATKREHIDLLLKRFGGRCPGCGITQIVDEFGNRLSCLEFDHFINVTQGAPWATWPLCGGKGSCHRWLTENPDRRIEMRPRFDGYQSFRLEEERALVPKPSTFAERIASKGFSWRGYPCPNGQMSLS